jgi:cardiolipin synthase
LFIEEYLQDLRRDRFSPRALAHYARRVLAFVREQIDASPAAVRSIWSVALGFFAADFACAVLLALFADHHLAREFFVDTALVIAPAFTVVTLLVGLLRDDAGYRLSAINVPIALTLLRIVLLPGIVLFLLDQRFVLALVAFVVAAVSDVADGWIARRTRQTTRLGTLLDPLIDIVFNLALFVALALAGLLPGWVAAVAALRYGLLLVGGACICAFVGPLRIQPTGFGRMTGVVMGVLIGLLALLHAARGALAEKLAPLTSIALGLLLTATVAQVVILGWYNLRMMRGKTEARGRVVGDVRWGAQ